jgi:hypothetical protein
MSLSDSHHFRKTVAGACMVLAPLCLLVAAVIHPGLDSDEAAQIGLITESRDAYFTAQVLGLASIVLAIPAVLGLMHMLREREVSAGHLGGGFALVGLVAFAAATGMAIVLWQATAPGADQGETVALLERLRDNGGVFFAVWLMTFAFPLGVMSLASGLVRARAVPAAVAGALALGAVGVALATPLGMTWVLIAAAALLVVGFGAIGAMVLRETDADWEHTPQFHGFRPAGGAHAA